MDKRAANIVGAIKRGETYDSIGQRHGITRERVRQIGRDHGVKSERGFNPADIFRIPLACRQRILKLYDRGMPFAHIAEIVGYSRSVVVRVAKLERGYAPVAYDGREWQPSEIKLLRKRYKTAGWPASRIGAILGRTRDEVIGKANRLGMSNSAYHARASRLARDRRVKIQAMRKRGITPTAISKALKIPLGTVTVDIWRSKQQISV